MKKEYTVIDRNVARKHKLRHDVETKRDSNEPPLFSWIEFNLTGLCNRVCVFCPRVNPKEFPNLKTACGGFTFSSKTLLFWKHVFSICFFCLLNKKPLPERRKFVLSIKERILGYTGGGDLALTPINVASVVLGPTGGRDLALTPINASVRPSVCSGILPMLY